MKLSLIQKSVMLALRVVDRPIYAELTYLRKKDSVVAKYIVNLANVEKSENYLITYAFAELGKRGSIRSFIKGNIQNVKLVKRNSSFAI
jgi:hypothetical protein